MNTDIVPFVEPRGLGGVTASPPALFLKEARAAERFFDFFTANIQNKHTRRAYYNAICKFSEFCAEAGVHDLAHVKPVHVAGYIESLREGFAKPTIKQHLAAIRMLFDWLIVGQVIAVNPAHAVRGPKHVVIKGRTPVLNREEARALLSSIDTSTLTGLRDRALIAVMLHLRSRRRGAADECRRLLQRGTPWMGTPA
jgi:site-specific recombinase XerD